MHSPLLISSGKSFVRNFLTSSKGVEYRIVFELFKKVQVISNSLLQVVQMYAGIGDSS
ncbi:hypothetical protein [Chryseobacterium sp. A321]